MVAKIQLGKQGVTEGLISNLKNSFKTNKNVRVSVLKSCCRDREELKKIESEILEKLGPPFSSRVIGYTIALKKLRKARTPKQQGL